MGPTRILESIYCGMPPSQKKLSPRVSRRQSPGTATVRSSLGSLTRPRGAIACDVVPQKEGHSRPSRRVPSRRKAPRVRPKRRRPEGRLPKSRGLRPPRSIDKVYYLQHAPYLIHLHLEYLRLQCGHISVI